MPFLFIPTYSLFQFFDTNIPELHGRTMPQEADVSFLVKQSRMLFSIRCPVLHGIPDISVQDHDPIYRHTDMIAIRHDLLAVPLTRRLDRLLMLLIHRAVRAKHAEFSGFSSI